MSSKKKTHLLKQRSSDIWAESRCGVHGDIEIAEPGEEVTCKNCRIIAAKEMPKVNELVLASAETKTFADYEQEARAELLEDARHIVGRIIKKRLRALEAKKMELAKAQSEYDALMLTEVDDKLVAQLALLPKGNGVGYDEAVEAIIMGRQFRVGQDGNLYTSEDGKRFERKA